MKKLLYFLVAATLLFIPSAAFAQNNEQGERVVVRAGETVNEDYFASGDVVEISGTVNGDVYAFAGQVLVDGTINGDLIALGGAVNIAGEVTQDVRVGGGNIVVTGKIGRNLSAGGGNIEITDNAVIGGGIVAGGGNITVAAPVAKSLRVGGGNVTISNKVGGSVYAAVSSIRLTSKASVTGNFDYWSDNEASIDQAAVVSGSVTKHAVDKDAQEEAEGFFTGLVVLFKIVSFFSTLLVAFFLLRFLPGFVRATNDTLKEKFGASLLWGLFSLIVTPIVAVILLFTVIGIPLAFILFALYGVALFISRIFVINWLGDAISARFSWKISPYLVFLLGLIVYHILTIVPIVSGLITFVTILLGLGTMVLTLNAQYQASKVRK